MSTSSAGTFLFLLFICITTGVLATTNCWYEGKEYEPGDNVPTGESCLTCRCGARGGAPLCRLQVCPELPVPPPRGCVLVHRRGDCCQRLVCETPVSAAVDTNSRTAPSRISAENFDIAPAEENGCVVNGTRYAEGSATDSSSLCEYCYCVRGKQRCVRPQCEMPLNGCQPKYRALACCPVSYDCNAPVVGTTSTTHAPPRNPGCVVDGARHLDGAQVRALAGECERCYCLRGAVRCVTLECAPPLMGCSPVFAPGRCCPVQYNCSKIITEPIYRERQENDVTLLMQLASSERGGLGSLMADLRRHREITENATEMTTEEGSTIQHNVEGESNLNEGDLQHDTQAPSSTTPSPNLEDLEKHEESEPKEEEASTETPVMPEGESTINPSMDDTVLEVLTTILSDSITSEETTVQVSSSSKPPSTETSQPPSTTKVPTTTSKVTSTKPPQSTKVTTKSTIKVTSTTTPTPVNVTKAASKTPPTTKSPPTTKAPTTTLAPATTSTEIVTTTELFSTTLSELPVIADRVDNIEDIDEVSTTTTVPPETSTSVTPVVTPSTTTLSPILEALEALLFAKNKEEIPENEYGQALPPSLPNITMIPFLPEDAVVDKKKDSYSSTETGVLYKNAVQSQGGLGFSPPKFVAGGFVPRQPPLLDETFYPTSPTPESGDILTAPQASLPPFSSLISITTPSPEGGDSITVESTITLANPTAPRACISPDGREVAHGELLAPPGPCEECRCDHGTVLCHEQTDCLASNGASTSSYQHKAQDRVDTVEPLTAPPGFGSLPSLTAPENKIAEDESGIFGNMFDFLFIHGESTLPPPPRVPTSTPAPVTHRPKPSLHREDPPPPPLPAAMASILKLAGCNIYGRMYRVGRIISELSGPCRECRCTDLGVQCRPLRCDLN